MLNKYVEFLTESKVISLILEDNLTCSGEFMQKLDSLKSKNSVANALYSLFSEEPYISDDLSQNYIDISDSDDTVTFFPDKKASKLSDEQSPFNVKGRTEIKVGRLAKAILTNKSIITDRDVLRSLSVDPSTLKDKDFEDFVNLYKASKVKMDHKFEIVNGSKISKYYDVDNYAFSERGTLGSSCMKHEECQEYFSIYEENKSCSLLVYLNSSLEVLGRALVWKLSKSPCESDYFMDRIYTANDSDVIKFINYADEQGWMYKYKQNCDSLDSLVFKYKGQNILGEVMVSLDKSDFDQYPFLDTLNCLNRKKKYLSNVPFAGVEYLNDTEGNAEECFSCNGSGVEDRQCPKCDGEGEIDCPKCDGSGDDCKKCDSSGQVKCKTCDGDGDGPCTECVGDYLIKLSDFIHSPNRWGVTKDQVEKEIERYKSEQEKGKEKKDKKKKKK